MTKIIRLLALNLTAALYLGCAVNQPCTVKMEQSPEVRGFRLGMSMADIQKRFPGFPDVAANQFGVATVKISSVYVRNVLDKPIGEDVVSFVSAAPFPDLNELKHVELKLLDGHLREITVFYPNDIKWKSADEFVQKTGAALKLNGSWQKVGNDSDYSETRSLRCGEVLKGFTVNAGFRQPTLENPNLEKTKLPYVRLEDFMQGEMEIYKRKKQREEKTKQEDEQRKQTFKP
ncbi:MAG TPA: hypothetical protein VGV59_07020 [Pyrinomonadaceae bacterium]|nr:hypothetical protein [Pyrinomonadaceae bacterium]